MQGQSEAQQQRPQLTSVVMMFDREICLEVVWGFRFQEILIK